MQRKGFKFKTIVIAPRESPRLGAMRIMYYLKVLQRDCVRRVMGGRKKGGKESGMNYQREKVNKTLLVAVAVFHRTEKLASSCGRLPTQIINPQDPDAEYLVNVQ